MSNIENLPGERWKPVKDFENRFLISTHGRLLSINGKAFGLQILISAIDSVGYRMVTLRDKPKFRNVRIHTLVAEHFLIKPDIEDACVNHIDGNKLNNHVINLEWCTKRQNCEHAVLTGLHNIKGQKHHFSKLTDVQVLEIRKLAGVLTRDEIATKFSMSGTHIRDIINRKAWQHI